MAIVVPTEEFSTFDDLISDNSIEYATVQIGEKKYRVGSLTADDFVAWTELRDSGPQGKKDAGTLLIIRSLVDGNGVRTGDPAKLEQARRMKLKASETLLRAIFKLNGINQKDEEATPKS